MKQNDKINFSPKEQRRDSEGRVIIDMNVTDDSAFLSTYAEKDSPIISNEVADFLDNTVQSISAKESIALRIHSSCIDSEEEKAYREAIKNYYSNRLVHTEREHKRSIIIGIILAVIGIFTLAIAQILDSLDRVLWTEVIDIAAWVFLWEAVDIFFFKMHTLRTDKKRYSSFADIKVEYYSNEKSGAV